MLSHSGVKVMGGSPVISSLALTTDTPVSYSRDNFFDTPVSYSRADFFLK